MDIPVPFLLMHHHGDPLEPLALIHLLIKEHILPAIMPTTAVEWEGNITKALSCGIIHRKACKGHRHLLDHQVLTPICITDNVHQLDSSRPQNLPLLIILT